MPRQLSNWLKGYAEFTAENEAPESYHLGVALTTLAGAVRRNIYYERAFFTVLTNLYIILVGPPGETRKSTAIRVGKNLLKNVPDTKFTTSATSPEALIQQLAALAKQKHQSLTAYSLELGSLLGNNPAGMIDILTDLWDGNPDWDKQTVSRGKETIKHPWLSVVAGTTRQWMGDNLSATAVEGGFVSRTIFIYEEEPKCLNPLPEVTPKLVRLEKALYEDLCHISQLEGQFNMTPDAEDLYKKWYTNPERIPKMSDPRTRGYHARKHIHTIKLAMMVALAESDDLRIEPGHLETAWAILEGLEPGMDRAFASVGKNIYTTDIERVLTQIIKSNGATWTDLLRSNIHAINKKELVDILDQLRDMGDVTYDRETGIYLPAKIA